MVKKWLLGMAKMPSSCGKYTLYLETTMDRETSDMQEPDTKDWEDETWF